MDDDEAVEREVGASLSPFEELAARPFDGLATRPLDETGRVTRADFSFAGVVWIDRTGVRGSGAAADVDVNAVAGCFGAGVTTVSVSATGRGVVPACAGRVDAATGTGCAALALCRTAM